MIYRDCGQTGLGKVLEIAKNRLMFAWFVFLVVAGWDAFLFVVYVRTFSAWHLSANRAQVLDEEFRTIPLFAMLIWLICILFSGALPHLGIRIKPIEGVAKKVVIGMFIFALIFYPINAVMFPRNELPEFQASQPADEFDLKTEMVFKQNIRRTIGSVIFFTNGIPGLFLLRRKDK